MYTHILSAYFYNISSMLDGSTVAKCAEHVLKDMHLSTRAVYDIMDATSDSKAGK